MLVSILKEKKETLFEEYDSICLKLNVDNLNKLTSELNFIQKILSTLMKEDKAQIDNIKELKKEEIEKLISILSLSEEEITNIKHIQVVSFAKEKGFDIDIDIDFSSPQIANFNNFLQKILSKIKEYETKISEYETGQEKLKKRATEIDEQILEIDILLEKINDSENLEPLTKSDFSFIYKLIENQDNSIKKSVLIDYLEYNDNISKGIKLQPEIVEIEEVKKCFDGVKIDSEIYDEIDKYSEEISKNIDLENAKTILEILKQAEINNPGLKIIEKFSAISLLTIVVYGTPTSVQGRLNKLIEKGTLYDIFFETPSVWISNFRKQKNKKSIESEQKSAESKQLLSAFAHEISYDEMLENEKFLRDKGFCISLQDKEGNKKVLKMPFYKIEENYNTFVEYGFFDSIDEQDFAVSAFALYKVEEKLHKFIEIGLLNPETENIDPYRNYIPNHPTALNSWTIKNFMHLSHLKSILGTEEYYSEIFSDFRKGCIAERITDVREYLGYNLNSEEGLVRFFAENFMDLTTMSYFCYEGIINDADNERAKNINIKDEEIKNILEKEEIKHLEQNYKVSEYIYKIGNQIISRYKVLKKYATLVNSYEELGENALMYCITHGLFISEENFQLISDTISYTYKGGRSSGLS